MANPPHGGILKVRTSRFSWHSPWNVFLILDFQDLVARDEPLRETLKAEAKTLPDIVLTDVRLRHWHLTTSCTDG